MRILVLQIAPEIRDHPIPRFEPQLGTALALLRARGHELALVGIPRYDVERIKSALAKGLPQLVYADIHGVGCDIARRTFEYIQSHEFVPIVAGGNLPSVDPALALSLPGVQAVVIGEPDASLPTYLERVKDPAAGQVVLGIWMRDERGLARPDVPPLVEDLDSLPFAERALFNYADWVRVSGQVEIAVGRGCPNQCAYCVNDWFETIYDGHGSWVRRRSPENILSEIDALRRDFPEVRLVRILDHAFALEPVWLAAFLATYIARCPLPFRCHLRANATNEPLISQLAAAHCTVADIEIISGSDFVRNEIFDMETSGGQIENTFAWLRAAGIRTRAIVYLGAPYESEVSQEETQTMLRRVKPDIVDVRPYYPFPGTRARETGQHNGWLHVRGEEQFLDDRPGIDMPACRPDKVTALIRRLRSEFPVAEGAPWWRRLSNMVQLFKR